MAHLTKSNIILKPLQDGTWTLEKTYSFALESTEPSSFKKIMQENIDMLTKDIEKAEDPAEKAKIKQKILDDLQLQYEQYQNALTNFKKYMSSTISQFHADADKKKKEMLEFCQNINQIKQDMLNETEKSLEEKKESLKRQLARETEGIKAYEKV